MENIIMFFNNKDSQNEIHHLNQATTLEINESSPLDAIFSKTGIETFSTYNPFNLMRFSKIKPLRKYAALTLLTILLVMSGSANAYYLTLYDIEENHPRANQLGRISLKHQTASAVGNLSSVDKNDVFSIKDDGGHAGFIEWHINSGANMSVWEDSNNNSTLDKSDRKLFTVKKNEEYKTSNLPAGKSYIANIYGGIGRYVFSAKVFKTIKLNVFSAKSFRKFDGGRNNKPDFYVKTKLFRKTKQSKVVSNNNIPIFRHNHEATLYTLNGEIKFEISLFDSDRFSKDDQADITPVPNARKLSLIYDYINQEVRTEEGSVLGKAGRYITVRGDQDNIEAKVTFMIR